MLKVLIIATSLLLTGCQEPVPAEPPVYEGEILERGGVYYKPKSVEPFSGLQRVWQENGHPRLEINYKDGKKHGVERLWHQNGRLELESNYKDGK